MGFAGVAGIVTIDSPVRVPLGKGNKVFCSALTVWGDVSRVLWRASLSMGMISGPVWRLVLCWAVSYYLWQVDIIIQRVIEFIRTIPTIPLHMRGARPCG
jgi:hypothetical protein